VRCNRKCSTSSSIVPVISVRLQSNFDFLDTVSKNTQVSNFTKIRPVGAELFHADGRTDGQTNMKKLAVAFHNVEKAPKSQNHLQQHTMAQPHN